MLLKTGRGPQDVVPLVAFAGDHLRNARTGFRKGPGLVENHGVSRRQRFEEPPTLDEDAAPHPFLHGGKHRQRGGKFQRARIIDEKDGSGAGGIAGDQPDKPGQQKAERHHRIGKPFGLALHSGLERFGILDEPDNLPEARAVAHARGSDGDLALLNHSPGVYRRTGRAQDTERFSGHGSLIDGGFAFRHHAVHRNGGPRADNDQIVFAQFADGDMHLPAFAPHPDGIDVKREALGEGVQRLLARPRFERFTETEQQSQQACRFEVTAQQGNADGGGIKDIHTEAPTAQRRNPFEDKGNGGRHRRGHPDENRHERPDKDIAEKRPPTRPSGWLGEVFAAHGDIPGRLFRSGHRQQQERGPLGFVVGIQEEHTPRTGIDAHPFDAPDGVKPVRKDLRLAEAETVPGAQADPSRHVMDNKKQHASSFLEERREGPPAFRERHEAVPEA